jgi:hypothetical protein
MEYGGSRSSEHVYDNGESYVVHDVGDREDSPSEVWFRTTVMEEWTGYDGP